MIGLGLSAALALLGTTDAQAQTRPEFRLDLPPYALNTRAYQLPSGLRVLLQEDMSAPMVTVTTVVGHGSTNDPVGREGTARMVEYLWFQSRHDDLPRVQDRIYELGASHHADTFADYTMFVTTGPADALVDILELEAYRLRDPLAGVTDELTTAARELVRNRARYRADDAVGLAMPHLNGRLFPQGHSYARLGLEGSSLDAISLADLQAFARDSYSLDNTTIFIVGGIDPEKMTDALFWALDASQVHPDLDDETGFNKYLASDFEGDEPDPDNPNHMSLRPVDPEDPEELLAISFEIPPRVQGEDEPPLQIPEQAKDVEIIDALVDTRTAVVGWSIPGAFRSSEYLTGVVAGVIEELFITYYRDEPGVLEDPITGQPLIDCRIEGMVEASILACSFEMKPAAYADSIIDRAVDQVSLLWNPDMTQVMDEKFNIGRNKAMIDVIHSLDGYADPVAGRGVTTALYGHFSGNVTVQSDTIRAINSTDGKTVSNFAQKWLDRKRAVRLELQPLAQSERLGAVASGEHYHGDMLGARFRSELNPELLTNEALAEAFIGPDADKIVERTLDNGLRVVVMPHGDAPVVVASMVYRGGKAIGDVGMDDFGETMQRKIPHPSLWEGSEADPLWVAGRWDFFRDALVSVDQLRASAGNLDAVLWKMRRQVETRTTALEYKSYWFKAEKASLLQDWQSRDWWADQKQWAQMAPEHPLPSRPGYEDLERLKGMGGTEVNAYHDQKFHPGNATLLIVGAVEPAAALDEAAKQFSGWQVKGSSGKLPGLAPANAPVDGGVLLFDYPGSVLSYVDTSCQLAAWDDKTYAAHGLLGKLLHEEAGSALEPTLDRLVYQVSGTAQQYPAGLTLLQLHAVADNGEVVGVVETFGGLLDKATGGELDEARLGVHKLHYAREFATRYQSLDDMTFMLIEILKHEDRGWGWYDTIGEHLVATSMDDLKASMGSCAANAVTTIKGPADKIGPALDAAGIAYQKVDWKGEGDSMIETHDPKAYKKILKQRAK